jgi:HTH-type transcriptional regulator/antitoxin HigA
MDIAPIATAEDHENALRLIETLWGASPDSADGRMLDILATLVDAYERRHFPLADVDPIEVLKTHLEMTGRTQKDLAALFGSASRASEILNRRRALTIEMVYKLHREWGIPADALVAPYEHA